MVHFTIDVVKSPQVAAKRLGPTFDIFERRDLSPRITYITNERTEATLETKIKDSVCCLKTKGVSNTCQIRKDDTKSYHRSAATLSRNKDGHAVLQYLIDQMYIMCSQFSNFHRISIFCSLHTRT
ncbi:hypothetical protein RclHR1_05390010 [Rhizophagus clarus]|uniref:Uncharacterized protein n=1 Tax=Rhizophagus clarus TaxID=94130 RepID=A0A2Z6RLT9_9GLOM|nr:hypothetical protein RclHR1_05390010 [Rhizophagus clarus]GET00576.1 hypothetical protein RCL_jg1032.t1 [Rhizophagus clarus]